MTINYSQIDYKRGIQMQVSVTDFKAHCTGYLKEIANMHEDIQITRRGKVVAVVKKQPPRKAVNPLYGSQKGSVLFIADDFDEPLGDTDWDASK